MELPLDEEEEEEDEEDEESISVPRRREEVNLAQSRAGDSSLPSGH